MGSKKRRNAIMNEQKKAREKRVEIASIFQEYQGSTTISKERLEDTGLTVEQLAKDFVKGGMDDIAGLIGSKVDYVITDHEDGSKTLTWVFSIVPHNEGKAVRLLLQNSLDSPVKRLGAMLEVFLQLNDMYKDKTEITFAQISKEFIEPQIKELSEKIKELNPNKDEPDVG